MVFSLVFFWGDSLLPDGLLAVPRVLQDLGPADGLVHSANELMNTVCCEWTHAAFSSCCASGRRVCASRSVLCGAGVGSPF